MAQGRRENVQFACAKVLVLEHINSVSFAQLIDLTQHDHTEEPSWVPVGVSSIRVFFARQPGPRFSNDMYGMTIHRQPGSQIIGQILLSLYVRRIQIAPNDTDVRVTSPK